MEKYLILALCIVASYMLGSILFAIVFTKLFLKKDIRKLGNTNAGASNTMRSAGPIAGVLTALMDIFKAFVPLILARIFLFKGDSFFDWIALYLIGLAAVLGHCRPFWNKFKKGGGGMATAVGVCAFFVPIDFAVSMIIGMIIAFTIMSNAEFKFGRWTMMFAAVVNPFVVLITSLLIDIPLFWHISVGGHNTAVIVGTFLLLIELFILNSYELFHWLKDPKDKVNPQRK